MGTSSSTQHNNWTPTQNHMNHVIHNSATQTHKTWNITYRFHSFSADLYISPRHLPIKLLPDRPPLCTSKASCHRPSAAQAFKATMPARSSSSTLPWNRLSCCFFSKSACDILMSCFDDDWCSSCMLSLIFVLSLSLTVCVCMSSISRRKNVPFSCASLQSSSWYVFPNVCQIVLTAISTFDFANLGSKSSKDWPFKAKAPESRSSWRTSS